MTRFQSSPPKLARNGHITSDHPHTWYLSAVRDDPWLCHDAHIFPSISARHTPKQRWKAVGWGCHPVWPHVEYQKACLHAPHHSEKSKSPSIKQCKAVEHVAPSMLRITDYAQPGQKPWSNPSLQNQISQFQSMLLPKTVSKTASAWSIPVPRRKPTRSIDCSVSNRGCKRSWSILAKILYVILSMAIGLQFLVCCKSPFFGTIVNNVCRQDVSNCLVQNISL